MLPPYNMKLKRPDGHYQKNSFFLIVFFKSNRSMLLLLAK